MWISVTGRTMNKYLFQISESQLQVQQWMDLLQKSVNLSLRLKGDESFANSWSVNEPLCQQLNGEWISLPTVEKWMNLFVNSWKVNESLANSWTVNAFLANVEQWTNLMSMFKQWMNLLIANSWIVNESLCQHLKGE